MIHILTTNLEDIRKVLLPVTTAAGRYIEAITSEINTNWTITTTVTTTTAIGDYYIDNTMGWRHAKEWLLSQFSIIESTGRRNQDINRTADADEKCHKPKRADDTGIEWNHRKNHNFRRSLKSPTHNDCGTNRLNGQLKNLKWSTPNIGGDADERLRRTLTYKEFPFPCWAEEKAWGERKILVKLTNIIETVNESRPTRARGQRPVALRPRAEQRLGTKPSEKRRVRHGPD